MKIQFAWHVHHNRLVEPLIGSIEERIAYIKERKPKNGRDIRLRLLKPVIGPLPIIYVEAGKAYVEAGKAYGEARKVYGEARKVYIEAVKASGEAGKAYEEAEKASDETWKVYDEAWKVYDETWKVYDEAEKASQQSIIELHLNECPNCPWDGKTIFPLTTKGYW